MAFLCTYYGYFYKVLNYIRYIILLEMYKVSGMFGSPRNKVFAISALSLLKVFKAEPYGIVTLIRECLNVALSVVTDDVDKLFRSSVFGDDSSLTA